MRAVQSLVRFSPSTIASRRRGAPTLRMISVGATASVGDTIAPSTNDSDQPRPIPSWAATATAAMVTKTSGIASVAIARAFRRSSRTEVKNAAPYRSGGRKIKRTMSGSSSTYGKPGCHLCDDARAVVERVRAQRPFELREVDVSLDPGLHREYGERIPVLALDGEELFEFHVEEAVLLERLDRVDDS